MNIIKKTAFSILLVTYCTPAQSLTLHRQIDTRTVSLENRSPAQPINATDIDVTVKLIPPTEQLEIWNTLTAKLRSNAPQNSILSLETAEKLNIIKGTAADPQCSLLGRLPIITTIGSAGATEILTTTQNISQNQEIIHFFVNNPELLKRTQDALYTIEEGVPLYLTFMQEHDPAIAQLFDQFFFNGYFKSLNKSIAAFGLWNSFKKLMLAAQNMPTNSGFIALLNYYDAYQSSNSISLAEKAKLFTVDTPINTVVDIIDSQLIQKHSLQKNSDINLAGDITHLFNSVKNMDFTDTAKAYFRILKNGTRCSLGDSIELYSKILSPTHALIIASGMQLINDCMYAYSLYNAYKASLFEDKIFINMQTRLIGVAKIISGLKELNAIADISNLESLHAVVTHIEQLLLCAYEYSEIKDLLYNLTTGTFIGDPSYWSNRPRILVTYYALQEHKEFLVAALHETSKIDALQSAAQTYLDHQDSPARYCFAQIIDNEKPEMHLIHFWNPLLDKQHATCNTIHLGHNGHKNILITGPNGSGKSVNMKGIALNIVLAQTFGIGSAEELTLTPFSLIETYLNETEDISTGMSTFMAEAKKLDNICLRVHNLQPGEKSFILMDEMLKGTVEEAGSQKVYEAGIQLAQEEHNICIMATHFLKPTMLEQTTNNSFVNYHVELHEPTSGSFIRSFKLIPGANLWWFGLTDLDKEKRTRFIKWITQLS